jgi:hypothetical protein
MHTQIFSCAGTAVYCQNLTKLVLPDKALDIPRTLTTEGTCISHIHHYTLHNLYSST